MQRQKNLSCDQTRTCFTLAILLLLVPSVLEAERVVSVTLCEDVAQPDLVPINIRNQFGSEIPEIHAVILLEELNPDTTLKAAWVSVDAIDVPNHEIEAVEKVAQQGNATFHTSITKPDKGWPAGNYKLNIYINERLATIATFSIVSTSRQPPSEPAPASKEPHAGRTEGSGGLSGNYILESPSVTLRLSLNQDPDRNLSGTLSSSTGAQFQVEGMVEDGVGVGMCYGDEGALFFEASPQGTQLAFALIEPDANNMPDYSRARQLVFTRQGESAASGLLPEPQPGRPVPYESRGGQQAGSRPVPGREVGDPNWGFKFRPPAGWKWQQDNTGAVLGHDTIAGMIIVFPHLAANLQQVQQELLEGLTEEGTQLYPTSRLQSVGDSALAGDYSGVYQGQQVKARGIGTSSPYGGGAYIIAVTTPNMYGQQLVGAAEAIARGMQYFKVEVSDLVRHFSGTWASVTSSTLATMTLAPDGSYSSNYEASYWGQDAETGYSDWDVTGQERNQGRWTVRGNREQGVIVITYPNGNETILEYQVHVEKGHTYWNEYLFNGKLYSKR
jgi:hypothetical protein